MSLPHKRFASFRRFRSLIVLGLAITACDDRRNPTAPQAVPLDQVAQPQPVGPDDMYSPRLKAIDPAEHPLLSTPAELEAGRYRFSIGSAPIETVVRDDHMVTEVDGEPVLRIVLSAETIGGQLVMETGPAYWHQVMESGTYGFTIPIQPGAPARLMSGRELPNLISGGGTLPILPLTHHFDTTDICATVEGVAGREVCGQPLFDQSFGAGVVVSISGTVDSLLILDGSIGISGDMDVTASIDEGGFSGGTPPTFSPCNRGSYLGCIVTPTGAALIDWLRQFAPSIPEASLPPVRMCIPGTPVRIRAGRWDYSGFFPVWRPPVFEQCRIASVGVLPTVILPKVNSARTEMRPRTKGDLTLRVRGDGKLTLTVAIPSIGWNAAYVFSERAFAKAEAGVFVEGSFEMKNVGATARFDFDRTDRVIQEWTPSGGWGHDHEPLKKDRNLQIIELDNPDSLVLRLGTKVSLGAELCLGLVKCDTASSSGFLQALKIGAKLGGAVSAFGEATWSRIPVNPNDPLNDNWKVSQDFAYDLKLEAGVSIPGSGFLLPNVPLEWEETFECCRVPVSDLWGKGKLRVATTTSGTNPDPDGYQLTIERTDTMPLVIDPGPLRLGKARDHGSPFQEDLPATGETLISSSPVPCTVWYSDALVAMSPVAGAFLAGARATGLDLPGRAITGFCDLLIAEHRLTLTGVAANCTVVGGATRDVWLQQANISIGRLNNEKLVEFEVVCGDPVPVGSLQITTVAPTAPVLAADYEIMIDGTSHGLIGPNATRTLTGVPAGTREVELVGGPTNCVVPLAVDIAVPEGAVSTHTFNASCSLPPFSIGVQATTTGSGTDPNGYSLLLDGVPQAPLPLNGLGVLVDLPALVPSVVHVADLAAGCRTLVPIPFLVTVDALGTPVERPVGFECTASPIVTLDGTIEKDAGALNPVKLRLADGSVRTLTGPARGDLAQLAGMAMRVHGVAEGTSFSVYHHEFVLPEGARRWSGIVAVRDGQTWLLGAEALRLIDPPSSITNMPGAFIWVSGTEQETGVRATLFGVMRVAP